VLHTQSFILPKGHLLSDARKYDVVSCSKCGFVYADTPVKQNVYDKYYAEMSKYEMGYDKIDLEKYMSQAKIISAIMKDKKASVIDVGAGNGGLLLALKELGYRNLTALDPSEQCVENIKKKGIRAEIGSVLRHKVKDKFDLVISSHVMEHLVEVGKAMKALASMARNRGFLYIEVPDASMYVENHVVPFYFFDTEHINHFDEVSLINLGLSHGLQVLNLGKNKIKVSETTEYPVIHIAYKSIGNSTDWKKYSSNRILNYVSLSKKEKASKLIIDELIKNNEEIVIWGAGNFTMRLLDNSNLSKCNIIGFIDKDPKKQGMKIFKKTVHNINFVKNLSSLTTIVVCSAVFSEQILAELKKMKIKNKVAVLK
jgi:SAM-dependent methyltransferase